MCVLEKKTERESASEDTYVGFFFWAAESRTCVTCVYVRESVFEGERERE